MAELLVFAKDFSQDKTLPSEKIISLQKMGDVIVWKPSGMVVAASWSKDGVVQLTTDTLHYVQIGQPIEVRGFVPEEYNGVYKAIEGTEGDVIVYSLDNDPGEVRTLGTYGWPWSVAERKNPLFRIIEWHGKDISFLTTLTEFFSPTLDGTGNPITIPQYRKRGIDVNLLPQLIKDNFDDATRVVESVDISSLSAVVEAAITERVEVSKTDIDPIPIPSPKI